MENQQYHIGKEIEKEMNAQGMSVRELAEKIHLSPQAVYDIFKKNHIATDRLAEIQRVLGRDFFKELSQIAMNNGMLADDTEEDEATLRERFEILIPEDRLHVLDREVFYQLAVEFVNTEHHKPLVIFHNDWQLNQPDIIEIIADRDLRPGQVLNVYLSNLRKKGKSDDEIIQDAKSMPQPILEVTCGNYNADLLFLKRLTDETGKKVYAYCRADNKLEKGKYGQIQYNDHAVDSFGAWCEQIHFVFVDDEWQSYRRNRWAYLAANGRNRFDVLSFVKMSCPDIGDSVGERKVKNARILKWLNDPKLLMDAYQFFLDKISENHHDMKLFRLMYFDDDEVSIKKNGETRWILSLPSCESHLNPYQANWLKDHNVHTSIWIEADENGVIDYEGSLMQMVNPGNTDEKPRE